MITLDTLEAAATWLNSQPRDVWLTLTKDGKEIPISPERLELIRLAYSCDLTDVEVTWCPKRKKIKITNPNINI